MRPEPPALSKNGRKLPFYIVLRKRIMNLYYQVPPHLRKLGGIPQWFVDAHNIPRYLLRMSGKRFSHKQVCVSMLTRLYYLYRYRLGRSPGDNTAYLHQVSSERLVSSCLSSAYLIRRWYPTVSVAYRRLKVLLCPYIGPSDH